MDKNNGSSGLGLGSVLTIIFVVLKLVGVIDWSWWWVLSPTLISIGLLIIVAIIFATIEAHFNEKYGIKPKKGKNSYERRK